MTRISVALCTYNGSRYLNEQLASIEGQTRLPDEMLVCDDCSKDETIAILDFFAKSASFPIRVIRNQSNLGFAKNFEKAIGLCTNDFIALSDQDDIWYPNKLEVLSGALERDHNAGFVCSDAALIDVDDTVLPSTRWLRSPLHFLPRGTSQFPILFSTLIKQNTVTGSAMMMRASLKPVVMPLSGRWAHDYWIAALSTLSGNFGIGLTEPLMQYRLHPSQSVGVHPAGRKLFLHIQSAPVDIWAKEVAMFSELKERVREHPATFVNCSESDLQLLDGKIAHLKARDLARTSHGVESWRRIITEFGTGGYRRFSLGWRSAVRDLLT